ncbi:MAG: alpha/beta fold hydrolase [Deltaproteobacteria bacterium]|nr:alpha/beta fold hydrolase [Deltaproteobacteria bacterium]
MKTPKFVPHPLLKHPQAQTAFGALFARPVKLESTLRLWVDLGDGDSLLLNEEPAKHDDTDKPVVIILHGLGGSGDGATIIRQSAKLNQHGYTAIRFHHRGCGRGVGGRAKQIYHSGRTGDIVRALNYLEKRWPGRPVLAIAYSLSGNMLLRLLGNTAPSQIPNLAGALAICPPIDLEACSNAIATARNRHIDRFFSYFVTKQAIARDRQLAKYRNPNLRHGLSLREFDAVYTAPNAGFKSREEYYRECSAAPVLAKISLPTTILAAKDDPIIPSSIFDDRVPQHINLRLEQHGGHVGFYAASVTPYGDRRWVDAFVLDWVKASHR